MWLLLLLLSHNGERSFHGEKKHVCPSWKLFLYYWDNDCFNSETNRRFEFLKWIYFAFILKWDHVTFERRNNTSLQLEMKKLINVNKL